MSLFTIHEEKLKADERTDFGIPSLKKYPMPDKDHVLAAIRMFNHVDKEHEKELAENILAKMNEYNISTDSIGKNNRLSKYIEYKEEPSISTQETINLASALNLYLQNEPISVCLESNTSNKAAKVAKLTFKEMTQEQKIAMLKQLSGKLFLYALASFARSFCKLKIAKYAQGEIRKTVHNTQIYDYFQTHVNKIFERYPNYEPISLKQYKRSSMFEKFAAIFRDKNEKYISTFILKRMVDWAYDAITPIFMPGVVSKSTAIVLGIPLKILVNKFFGISLKIGSVTQFVFEFEGKAIGVGIDLEDVGFRIVDIKVYALRPDGHITFIPFPNPPEKMYEKIDKDHLQEFLAKYPGKTLKEMKKELEEFI